MVIHAYILNMHSYHSKYFDRRDRDGLMAVDLYQAEAARWRATAAEVKHAAI